MKLADYLEKNALSRQEFADRIGVSTETIRLYLAGERTPRRKQMTAITEQTGGKVTANDFYSAEVAP